MLILWKVKILQVGDVVYDQPYTLVEELKLKLVIILIRLIVMFKALN